MKVLRPRAPFDFRQVWFLSAKREALDRRAHSAEKLTAFPGCGIDPNGTVNIPQTSVFQVNTTPEDLKMMVWNLEDDFPLQKRGDF